MSGDSSTSLAYPPTDLDDAIAIEDVFVGKLDLPYARRQAEASDPDVRRRLDLMFAP